MWVLTTVATKRTFFFHITILPRGVFPNNSVCFFHEETAPYKMSRILYTIFHLNATLQKQKAGQFARPSDPYQINTFRFRIRSSSQTPMAAPMAHRISQASPLRYTKATIAK